MGWPWRRRDARGADTHVAPSSGEAAQLTALQCLREGDAVVWGEYELTVQGRVDFEEDGSRWTELHVDDGQGTRCWVGIEPGVSSPITFWYELPGEQVESGSVGDAELGVGGVTYRRGERGRATFTAVGSTGTAPSGCVDWVDYRAADGRLLGCERFDDGWQAHLGQVVPPAELTTCSGPDA